MSVRLLGHTLLAAVRLTTYASYSLVTSPVPLFIFVAGMLTATSIADASTQYFVTDLGPLGTGNIYGMNNSGAVIIDYIPSPAGNSQPFLFQNGVRTGLSSAIGGANIWLYGINNNGDIVGTSGPTGFGGTGFILYQGGFKANFPDNPTYGTTVYPLGVNDSDAVAAQYESPGPGSTALRWVDTNADRIPQAPEYQNLPPPSPYNSASVEGINNSGIVVGAANTNGAGEAAVRWVGGSAQNLEVSQTEQSGATAINNAGIIVGDIGNAGILYTPFLWDPNAGLTVIPANGIASDINNLNQVVGGFNNGDAAGWVWSQAAGYKQLQNFITGASGWTIDQATCINDDGQIAGIGYLNGVREGYLLTPVPEPASSSIFVVGAATTIAVRRRHRRPRR